MPTPRQHALLSASSAHRWLACTAAPHFEENFPDGTSSYAEEGTLAHAICELYARKKFTVLSTRKFNSELKKLQARPLYSDEMLRTAEAYVDYLTEKAMQYTAPPHVAMEVKVDLTAYVPDGFGTCDCIMIGGDTLLALCRASGASALLAHPAVKPGWGCARLIGGTWHGVPCYSRSGAFG